MNDGPFASRYDPDWSGPGDPRLNEAWRNTIRKSSGPFREFGKRLDAFAHENNDLMLKIAVELVGLTAFQTTMLDLTEGTHAFVMANLMRDSLYQHYTGQKFRADKVKENRGVYHELLETNLGYSKQQSGKVRRFSTLAMNSIKLMETMVEDFAISRKQAEILVLAVEMVAVRKWSRGFAYLGDPNAIEDYDPDMIERLFSDAMFVEGDVKLFGIQAHAAAMRHEIKKDEAKHLADLKELRDEKVRVKELEVTRQRLEALELIDKAKKAEAALREAEDARVAAETARQAAEAETARIQQEANAAQHRADHREQMASDLIRHREGDRGTETPDEPTSTEPTSTNVHPLIRKEVQSTPANTDAIAPDQLAARQPQVATTSLDLLEAILNPEWVDRFRANVSESLVFGSFPAVVFRRVMKFHMDACHAAGLDATQAANLLINGAAYLIGAAYSERPEDRERLKEELVTVFRRKVDQAVEEGRADRAGTFR